MPKRSNDFQKLVFAIKQHVSEGAQLTESKFLIDNITGAKREVDICIEHSIGEHKIIISIECRDHKRKATVSWIEAMKCKHERLPTNALVLVSKNGFSREAKIVAQKYNIETLTFHDMDVGPFNKLFGKLYYIIGKSCTLTTRKVIARVEKVDCLLAENIATFPDNIIFSLNGDVLGTFKELVETKLNALPFVSEMLMQGNETHKTFEVLWKEPTNEKGNSLYLCKEEPYVLRKVETIKILGKCEFLLSKFSLEHGKLGKTQIAWGKGDFMRKNSMLVVTEDEKGKRRLSFTTKGSASAG